jgi:hypothetical protein
MAAKKKVIYFTAGDVPTTDEKADIAKLNAAAATPYEVAVRSGIRSLGTTGNFEAADYVSGTVPASAPWNAKPVIDPDAIPNQSLSSTQAIVTNGQQIEGVSGNGNTATITVNPTTKAVSISLSST